MAESSETWRYGQDWPAADGEEWTTLIVPHEDERGMDDRRLALPKWFVAVIVRDHEQARLVAELKERIEKMQPFQSGWEDPDVTIVELQGLVARYAEALEAIKDRAARYVELNCDHKWGDVYFGIKTPEPDEVLVNYMWRCEYCGSIKLDHGTTIIRGDLEAFPQRVYANAQDALSQAATPEVK